MAAFTVRLPDDVTAKLDDLASKLDRSRSWLVARAIEEFVARESVIVDDILQGLAEADRGEFATDEEVAAAFAPFHLQKSA
jgi:predicted transcriptional regulator